jgi:hypothetical protein
MVAEDHAFEDGAGEQLEQALKERFSTGQFIGISLVLDILEMNGRNA